jgi:hypothetical protein
MQYPGNISQIKERAANIRLRMNHLADLAGVPPSTAHAKTGGRERDVRASTLRKLAEAQVNEELRLRDYLLSLHPLPRTDEERAA